MRKALIPASIRPMPADAFSRRLSAVTGLAIVIVVALSSLIWSAKATTAPLPCGSVRPKTFRYVRPVLTLDQEEAVTNRALKRSTEERTLSLVFSIKGCPLYIPQPPPSLFFLPAQGGDELPDGALTLKRAFVAVDGSTLFLTLQIHPTKLDPGTYSSYVIANARYLGNNRTAVTVSRSESAAWKVLLVGTLAALAGLAWLLILALPTVDASAFKSGRTVVLGAVAVAAGVYAAANNYYSQEVWTFSENVRGLATAAFVAASSGSIAAILIGSKTGKSG
jgi:hypothetical protein